MAAVLFAALFLASCPDTDIGIKKPVLSLHSAVPTKVNFTDMEMLCKVNVENPNSMDIPFPDIDWDLFMNTNAFLNGRIEPGQAIKSRSTVTVDVPVGFDYLGLINSIGSLIGSNKADYKVALAAKFTLPILGNITVPFEHNGVIPIPQAPEISFAGANVKSTSFTGIVLETMLDVKNNNIFDINVKDLSYNIRANNTLLGSGEIPNSPKIESGKTTKIPLEFSLSYLGFGSALINMIIGNSASYTGDGEIVMGADLPGFTDYKKSFNF